MGLVDRLGVETWPRSAWPVFRGVFRALTWLLPLTGAAATATYGLALLALASLEPPGSKPGPGLGDARVRNIGTIAAHIDEHGRPSVSHPGARAAIGGHEGRVMQALLVGEGAEVITVGEDGTVRATRVGSIVTAGWLDAAGLTAALDQRLWRPFGRPLADAALWTEAQILPLSIPEHVRGRRGRTFRDCRDGFCGPAMVEMEPGRFLMGSPWLEDGRFSNEGPRELTTVRNRIGVGKFEVTFDEWDACADDGGCKVKPETAWGRGRQPVHGVSWHDVTKEYLPWLNRKLGLEGAVAYRLPTEAEWEYAARAGTTTAYSYGDKITKQQAQFSEGAFGSAKQTMEVGKFPPNAFGLHDMHGNVWEWVADCYVDRFAKPPVDGTAVTSSGCVSRVFRGGSWYIDPQGLRSANRSRYHPDFRDGDLGFRLAMTLSP